MKHLLLLVFFLGISIACAEEHIIADFENGYGDWIIEGDAFGEAPARGKIGGQQEVRGFQGNALVNTFLNEDESTGTLTSPELEIDKPYITFLIGGGNHPDKTGIELLVDGQSVRSATGKNQEMVSWVSWDVKDLNGKQARLRVFDRSTDGFGHINIDHILATDRPRRGPGVLRLSDYRKTAAYYDEPYRPQYHFTPPINWMNDPNGLVFFRGEYHLFYQHNPHGNSWGHMSWGHAVSTDLVHWKHLPIALHEEYAVMIFSGCCVVDWKNSSGFGRDGQPPMVAIYTGHGLGKQTQDIAYSNDRGRTWTKFSGNPVIDKNEADFRDPKVFWHEPTKKWVMVVAMAVDKYVEFYSSDNLKDWTYMSKFGPAGVKDKPNWECPDLFELPIEGTDKSKWVLEVDMGNGSVAGGSGGEYFVGHFDGKEFKCDHHSTVSKWVDFGRDFYAPVSFSDIPKADGRRIWIGWMNNWETSLLPTRPWRSAMSIPRALSLRETDKGLKLIQKPVRELQNLRTGNPMQMAGKVIQGELPLDGLSGDRLELKARFRLGGAESFGFHVRTGESEHTVVGYDARRKSLYVDRTNSGVVDFHPAFAGRHDGPLKTNNGTVEMHLFVDRSSVEVFGNDGETVLTERIFPRGSSDGVSVFADGGKAQLVSLKAWKLKSAFRK